MLWHGEHCLLCHPPHANSCGEHCLLCDPPHFQHSSIELKKSCDVSGTAPCIRPYGTGSLAKAARRRFHSQIWVTRRTQKRFAWSAWRPPRRKLRPLSASSRQGLRLAHLSAQHELDLSPYYENQPIYPSQCPHVKPTSGRVYSISP